MKSLKNSFWRHSLSHQWTEYKPSFLVAALILAWFAQDQFFARHLVSGLWLWLGAGIIAAWSFAGQPDRLKADKVRVGYESLLLTLIFLIALVFRFWKLSGIPHGYFTDEACSAMMGLKHLKGAVYLLPPGWDQLKFDFFYYLNACALYWGAISAHATRMIPALAGSLTVVMTYFLARRMFSRPVALATVMLLAGMRWHVNFSRMNLGNIFTPFFSVAAFYFLLRGLETRKPWFMLLAGMAIGIGLQTYIAFGAFVLALGLYLGVKAIREKGFLKQNWKGLLLLGIVAAACYFPANLGVESQAGRFVNRSRDVLIFNNLLPEQDWAGLWSNVKKTMLMFNYFGDCNGRHNIPEVPMLDSLTGLLFGLGLIWNLTHPIRRHSAWILLWFISALLPGFLTIEAPQGIRCIGAIIPVIFWPAWDWSMFGRVYCG